jgi:hypothetical protein
MRGSLIALAATAALVASPALAQSSANVVINGSILATCSSSTLSNTTVTITPANFEDSSNVGALAAAFTGTGGIPITNTAALVTCNGAGTTIGVDATAMTGPSLPGGAGAAGFSNTINFLATVSKDPTGFAQNVTGDVIATNNSTATPTTATVGLLASKLNISVSNAVAGGILIAGAYSGSVAITLTAGV